MLCLNLLCYIFVVVNLLVDSVPGDITECLAGISVDVCSSVLSLECSFSVYVLILLFCNFYFMNRKKSKNQSDSLLVHPQKTYRKC